MEQPSEPPRMCIWKKEVRATDSMGNTKVVRFPCRFPDKPLNSELCVPCLLGDLFSAFYVQTMNAGKANQMQEEIMTFLRNLTDDGSLDSLK